jgi:PAS domain-containing protein
LPTPEFAASGDGSTSEVSLDGNPVEHYRELFHDAPCPYFVMAVDGTLTEANKAFWRLIDQPDGAINGINFRNLLSSAGAIYYNSQVLPSLLLSGTRNEVALDIRAKSGRKLVLANFCAGPPRWLSRRHPRHTARCFREA